MTKTTSKKAKPTQSDVNERSNQNSRNGGLHGNQSSALDEIADRLQRLETSRSHGNSDVYKFALFFIMGVVMTVLLYPHASKTVESFTSQQRTSVRPGTVNTAYEEGFVDVDEPLIERENRTLQQDSGGIPGDSPPGGAGNVIDNKNDRVETVTNTDVDVKADDKKTVSKRDVNTGQSLKVSDDTAAEGVDIEEDPLIGEGEFDDGVQVEGVAGVDPLSDDGVQVATKEFKTVENGKRGERVDLFNMDGDVGELPIRFVDDNDDNKHETNTKRNKPTQKKKSNSKSTKQKGSNKGKSTKKSKKTNENSDSGAVNNDDMSKLPPEIRNFKATYQKDITPTKIFVDGRRIPPMELLPQKPNNSSVKVWMFEEFLSEAECDGLMRVHRQHVEDTSKTPAILCFDSVSTLRKHLQSVGKPHVQVSPRDFTQGTTCVNASFSGQLRTWLKGNWSYSTAFYPGESRFAAIFEQRVQQAMGLKPENGGKFQITSYPLGIGYKSHTDCTEGMTDKRDRVATVLVYLDTVSEGGETDFPELGIWVRPRKARALLWNNMNEDGDCEPLSIHQAKQVVDGHKVILQRWYYYKSFYSLGKRPPQPPLPRREPGQPRVSCDEYEHGSCRWYDEWNFEHMLEYERQKYNLV